MSKEQKDWNDANIKQVVNALTAAHYHCGSEMRGPNGRIEFWIGGGTVPVILLQVYAQDMGFELWKPLTTAQDMREVITDLKACLQGKPKMQDVVPAVVSKVLNE